MDIFLLLIMLVFLGTLYYQNRRLDRHAKIIKQIDNSEIDKEH